MSLTIHWATPNAVAWSFGDDTTHYSQQSAVAFARRSIEHPSNPDGTAVLSYQRVDESTVRALLTAMDDAKCEDSEPTWTEQTREDRRECQAGW